ncbi:MULTISPECIES: malonyl-CoA decarboxylase [Bradyrhizobium]|uniref:malonyl-CoA decarboxylase n=1 Tax=Bradyrhizobium TaxID=374 RepID=UPI0004B0B8B9|nr:MULTISPECIES: malonyl-CoA decarboxylase [Bradyrhizobium]MCS3446385.1 malonyl-CoA decarboxylase [Bradyrhizobium elkanii]MCS3562482.1 malonyl-CoA decarboxylase [Bradyrhizobium elkanii]MCW2147681.1 malonyl-CoA decarboxylase [Bradyrhizobium elkanii]MCW2353234.1 malonyl-CoA decarboxylase [Bradyrhizobium elkanii]MCW2371408.1 malonyl-CoA decarboxylase [Bradyrhizobium elkanii]
MTHAEHIPSSPPASLDQARQLAAALLSERGEASGALIARQLQQTMRALDADGRHGFQRYLAGAFQPDAAALQDAAKRYLADGTAVAAAALADAADPPRQEVLRRMNMAPGGTASLIAMRSEIASRLGSEPELKLLDADLKHLFVSWFNRGFLELRRIDWQSPAAVLEKLIAYEAVHEIKGWDDLRRRLAPDRRCFAFFHPALPGEPLIFVEVALVQGLATAVPPLLVQDADQDSAGLRATHADTAIFYSISNCQDGLRGVSFGNFLIKQVVEELQTEFPQLNCFSTLSPIPGFRRWLGQQPQSGGNDVAMLRELDREGWWHDAATCETWRPVLMRLCAQYLTRSPASGNRIDPVARFHLGNGARLERINWLGNTADRAMAESFGIMVNYLYDHDSIERNHEAFARVGEIVRSPQVDALL